MLIVLYQPYAWFWTNKCFGFADYFLRKIMTMSFQEKLYSNIDGLEHDCGNSIANALGLLQSCTKPSI